MIPKPMLNPILPNDTWFAGECGDGFHTGAVFTVELGTIVSNGFDIGLDKYPIFDEAYREGLNAKILDHFWFREIGQETPALFRFFLNRKMNEIMPYYNQLYKSTLLEFDPLWNYDLTSEGTSKSNSNQDTTAVRNENSVTDSDSTTDSETIGYGRTLVNTTPQMQLAGYDDYATNITDTESDSLVHGTGTQTAKANVTSDNTSAMAANATDAYVSRVTGLTGITKSSALQQFRETFLNIDMLVIGELEELFMGIWSDYENAL